MLSVKAIQFLERKPASVAWVVTLLLVFAMAAISAEAQQPPDSPPVIYLPGSFAPSSGTADPRAREDAAKLAELTGIRQKLEKELPESMRNAVGNMRRRYPGIDPRFIAEWEKRMRAQLNVDDYIAVFIEVYDEHFTAAELEEMIEAVRARQSSKPVTISPQLAEKVRANAIDIQSEIMGGFTEVGARLGGEIGRDIGKEHPDWVKNVNPAAAAGTK
jgi:hypothetical protein